MNFEVDYGVSQQELAAAQELYPSVKASRTRPTGARKGWLRALLALLSGRSDQVITHVIFEMSGIAGGGNRSRRKYRLFADVGSIRDSMPDVWVLRPDDARIGHFNIYRQQECRVLNKELPKLCWGGFSTVWYKAPKSDRRLGPFMELVNQFLNEENPKSPAR